MLGILLLPIIEIVVLGAAMGGVGALAIAGRRVFFAESLSHATFPGAVLGVVVGQWLGGDISTWLFIGAGLLCIPLAWLMRFLSGLPGISATAAAGIVLTLGFALGVFLLRWFQPLPVKVEGFLTGSLLAVSESDVIAAVVVLLAAVVVIVVWGRKLVVYYFDPVAFRVAGLSTTLAEAATLGLLCAAMVVAIPAVGSILSIALLVAPAAGVMGFVRTMRNLILLAAIAGVMIGLIGLYIAVHFSLSTGGTIAVVAGVFYVACRFIGWGTCMSWNFRKRPKITSNAFGT